MKKVKTTTRQAKAMELIRQGKTPTDAMREAGYTEQTVSAPTRNLLSRPGAQAIIEQYKEAYASVGITPQYMAQKTKEWLDATKIKGSLTEPDKVVPDYKTQLKAAEIVRKDWELGQELVQHNQQNNYFLGDEQLKRIIED